MKAATTILALLAAGIGPAAGAKDFFARVSRQGTVGLGQEQYAPVTCAHACRGSIAGWMLDCPDAAHHDHVRRDMMMTMTPSPACYASNDPFLMSLAWCIKTHCSADIPFSLLERYWEKNVAGRMDNQPLPKYSYQDALARIISPPTTVHNSNLHVNLNGTELVSEFFYSAVYGSLEGIEINISLCNQYTLVVLLTCSLVPVLLSLFRFLPLPRSFVSKFYAHIIDPPVFGSRHAAPAFFGLGIVPTRGQAIFIFYIWTINIILSAVNHVITWPNLWFDTIEDEVLEWVGNRVGMLSFANLILAVLFSSRNNVLLHLTSWTRSTFVLLHRWVAVISIIQAVLHTALCLQLQISTAALPAEAAYPYWYWGLLATITLILIVPASLLPVRQRAYEFFLAWHIVFAILSMVGCFLHIYLRYHWQWGYEIWVVVPLALFGLDWFLIRPLRLLHNGLGLRAHVEIGQAYLYFPTLSWRVWENHPFSVVALPGCLLQGGAQPGTPPSEDLERGDGKGEAAASVARLSSPPTGQDRSNAPPGITFFIRRREGLTAELTRRAGPLVHGLPVLVESSYGAGQSLVRSPDPRPSAEYPNLLILAGGVGITAVLHLLERPRTAPYGSPKLYWVVRSVPLVRAVERLLGEPVTPAESGSKRRWLDAEVSISVGKRLVFPEVLGTELLSGEKPKGATVVVCGPPGMSDEVRLAVVTLARRGAVVRLTEERFGW